MIPIATMPSGRQLRREYIIWRDQQFVQGQYVQNLGYDDL